ERKKRLDKIKEDCKQGDGRCSGDGENCNEIVIDKDKIFDDLKCNSCAISCRSYKKWIDIKKKEFDKQKSAYEQQKEKYTKKYEGVQKNSSLTYDKDFVGKLNIEYKSIDLFLKKLKDGPCKTNNDESGQDKTGNSHIKFDDAKTFVHTNLCDPCSEFKIDCTKAKCTGDEKTVKCQKNKITANDIKDDKNGNENINMLVSDTSKKGVQDDLSVCISSGIFQGIKENKWECGEVCGVDICSLKKTNNNNGQEKYEHITVKEFLKRWLETFLEDYNKINNKISHCINNGNGSICTSDCGKKCDCVGKWIEIKKKEWEEIKKRYLEQHKVTQSQVFEVKSFLQQGMFTYDVDKAIKPCTTLDNFETSKECAVDASSENGNLEKRDIVECLFQKLQNKIDKCKDDHPQPSNVDPKTSCQESTPPDDEDLLLEEEEEYTVGKEKVGNKAPAFCEIEKIKEEVKEEEKCETAQTTPKEPAPPPSNEDKVEKPEEEAPAPDTRPVPSPVHPTLSDQPTNSISDILSSTIPFGIAI
ncbi:hypothetical protein PFFCH_05545, partial [Plasmodium falciparum FCH/4]